MLANVPVTEVVHVDAVLDALDEPSSSEVYAAVEAFSDTAIASAAAARALAGGGGSLPAGGSTGEVLTKASDDDGDADWEAPGGGSQLTYVQDSDPGAVGAGATWLNTTDPTYGIPSTVRPLLVRNAADDGWDELGLVHRDVDGTVRGFLSFSDGGMVARTFAANGDVQGEFFMLGDHMAILGTNGRRLDLGYPGELGVSVGVAAEQNAWGVSETGAEYLKSVPAPDDADVPTSQRYQWFDHTNGAPKLRFKERSQNGTLVTGVSASEEWVEDHGYFSEPNGNQAPFVDPLTATAAQVAQALIDAGLMAAS